MPEERKSGLPEGFKPVELDWMDLEAIDWRSSDVVQGTAVGGRYVMLERDGALVPTALIKLTTSDGALVLWETARLADFMGRLKAGDEVFIAHKGKVDIGGGRRIHNFNVGVKPHPDRRTRPLLLGPRPAPQPLPDIAGIHAPAAPAAAPSAAEPEFDDDIPF